MTKVEARLAVKLHSEVMYDGIKFYAYGMSYINPMHGKPVSSLILHDLNANSICYVDYDKVTISDWKADAKFVERYLNNESKKSATDTI